ncbi:MAG TPA: hypothetical protein VHL34_00785 [Rhizomicrobium sp.]|jgi:hypothetical protein|nr:hypothetical protein [Rhizomicrobium sp.]
MTVYEIRFIGSKDETLLVYVTVCDDTPMVANSLAVAGDLPYVRYELWRGREMLSTGARQ